MKKFVFFVKFSIFYQKKELMENVSKNNLKINEINLKHVKEIDTLVKEKENSSKMAKNEVVLKQAEIQKLNEQISKMKKYFFFILLINPTKKKK